MNDKRTVVVSFKNVLKHVSVIFILSLVVFMAQTTTELVREGRLYRQQGVYMYGMYHKTYNSLEKYYQQEDFRESYYVSSCFLRNNQLIGTYSYAEICEVQDSTSNKLLLYSIGLLLDFGVVIVGYIVFLAVDFIRKRIRIRFEK